MSSSDHDTQLDALLEEYATENPDWPDSPKELDRLLLTSEVTRDDAESQRRVDTVLRRIANQGANEADSVENAGNLTSIDWKKFPIDEMVRRGWISDSKKNGTNQELRRLVAHTFSLSVLCHRGIRAKERFDDYALEAWKAQVARRATNSVTVSFRRERISVELARELVKLSRFDDGPRQAVAFLADVGVAVVIEPHLSGTFLDGAAFRVRNKPIIGMTLRHDRLDNFWFCLLHELGHVALHLNAKDREFFDDIDADCDDDCEVEADSFAGDCLIPASEWDRSPAKVLPSPEAVQYLADALGVHPAIVAGKVRRERNAYHLLAEHVGQGEVRCHFEDIDWSRAGK